MKLSDEELRWLTLWEKRERMWPVARWVCVLFGVISMACGYFIFNELDKSDIPDRSSFLFVPFYFFGQAGVFVAVAFVKWRGDIKLRLLLRLFRESVDKSE
jgi:hypothetical protein